METEKQQPPLLKVVRKKKYKSEWATLDKEPCIVINDNACSPFVHSLKTEDIVGVNHEGMKAILNGAVPPEMHWLQYLHRSDGKSQPVEYTTHYPIQTAWLSLVQDLLLKENTGVRIEYDKIELKDGIPKLSTTQRGRVLGFLKSSLAPSFQLDLIQKYKWIIKKFNISDDEFERLLDALVKEEDGVSESLPTVEDVYDYTKIREGAKSCDTETP